MSKRSNFPRSYGIFVLALSAFFLLTLLALCLVLGNFQRRTDRAAEAAIRAEEAAPHHALETWLEGMTGESWRDLWLEANPDSPDDPEALAGYFVDATAEGSLAVYRDAEWSVEQPVYLLRSGERDLARLAFSRSGDAWRAEAPEFLLKGDVTVRAEISSCEELWCNGVLLTAAEASSEKAVFPTEHVRDLVENPVTVRSYELSGFLLEPELQTEVVSGIVPVRLGEGFCLPEEDSGAAAKAAERGEAFVETVLNYYMSGESDTEANLNSCVAFTVPGTAVWETLKESYDGVSWNPHYSDRELTELSASPPVCWGANCISVDVSFHACCSFEGRPIDYAEGLYRLVFLSSADGYVLEDMEYREK